MSIFTIIVVIIIIIIFLQKPSSLFCWYGGCIYCAACFVRSILWLFVALQLQHHHLHYYNFLLPYHWFLCLLLRFSRFSFHSTSSFVSFLMMMIMMRRTVHTFYTQYIHIKCIHYCLTQQQLKDMKI